MRVAMPDVGEPLTKAKSLRQFLGIMYDTCVGKPLSITFRSSQTDVNFSVQRNLYRKRQTLHRDISDTNILIAPDDEKLCERYVKVHDEVKYLNQILAGNE